MIMLSYIYPYHYLSRAFGSTAVPWTVLYQFILCISLLAALTIKRGQSRIATILTSVIAVIWYLAVSVVVVVAHIH